jgi:hypothetical protein
VFVCICVSMGGRERAKKSVCERESEICVREKEEDFAFDKRSILSVLQFSFGKENFHFKSLTRQILVEMKKKSIFLEIIYRIDDVLMEAKAIRY